MAKHYEDLIERLRNGTKLPLLQALMDEAADAIEELQTRGSILEMMQEVGGLWGFGVDGRLYRLDTADVRPVVLCKDCRHRGPEDRKCDSGEMERQGCVFPVDDDYFCAYGER